MPGVRDDTALVEGLSAGEPWARAALFERYAPPIERLLRKIERRSGSEDVVRLRATLTGLVSGLIEP